MAEDTRPLCKCHGDPMLKASRQPSGKQKWACCHNRRSLQMAEYWERGGKARRRQLADDRKAVGLCVRCGKEPLLGEALGWNCLNEMEARCVLG